MKCKIKYALYVLIGIFLIILAIPKVHTEKCYARQLQYGVIELLTESGEIYHIYGNTDATEVIATFEDNKVVSFENLK